MDIQRFNASWNSKRGTLVFLVVMLAMLLPSMWRIASPFLTAFILASILAIVINPLNRRFHRRVQRFGLATFLTTSATVLLLGVVLALAGFVLSKELRTTYDSLSRQSLEEGGWPSLVTHTVDRIVDSVSDRLPVDKEAIRTELLDGMRTATGYLLNNVGAAVGGAVSLLVTGMLVSIFLYFLLRYGEEWIGQLSVLMPVDEKITASLFQTVHDSVVANVYGMLAVVVGQGLLLGLGFWIVGVGSPALWGMIGGLASIIPVVGCPMVWVPAVIAFAVKGAYGKAVVLGLWGALVVGSVDNLLRPFVVASRDKQHPVLIALAAVGGTYAFGVLGILLGPLVLSLAASLLKELGAMATTSEQED